MSDSHSKRSHKDPVRIVYHAGDRTFARLFNERSLEEVKDVVRKKLGLEPGTDVSLKQMSFGALLDLEDDGDFQAFRVLLESSVSADIQVTVSRSQGSVALHPQGQPLAKEQNATTLSVSPSRKQAGVALASKPNAHREVARTTEASISPVKTLLPLARKRKASFGDVGVTPSDKPTKERAPAKPTKAAEPSAVSKPAGTEEPEKKKRKKDSTKKVVEATTTEVAESSATKASAPKGKTRKSTTLDDLSKHAETSEPPVKKRTKVKKDDSTRKKKSSAPVDEDGMNQSISHPSKLVNDISLPPEDPVGSDAEDDTSETRKSERAPIGACAAIPQTTASTIVQSEVAAAILSGYLSKPNVAVPPKPPVKRTSVKRSTKKPSTSSSPLPVGPTAMTNAIAHEPLNVPTERGSEQVILTKEPPQQTLGLNGLLCPICLEEPFHIRYFCPTVLKGPDAIRERLEELERANTGTQQSLINQLKGLLRDAKGSQPTSDAAQIDGVQLGRIPNIPNNSQLSEVTVENRDEGSSSDSSDDISEGEGEHQESSTPQGQKTPGKLSLPSNDDLEAIVRGPAPKRQSILHLVDRIVDGKSSNDSGSEESEAELEEDPEEDACRSKHQSATRMPDSSDTESEEVSRSPSPCHLDENTPNNLEHGTQGSKSVGKAAEHQDGDVIMADSIDPPVLDGQHEGGSEETQVGSHDHMVMDESIGEKGPTVAGERLPSPVPSASIQRPSCRPSNKPKRSSITGVVDPTPNRDGTLQVAREVEPDPIEPADDLEPLNVSHSSNADPIEAPGEEAELSVATVFRSTPRPGVSKRIKTRDGEILEDEADRPILVEHLASHATDEVTPAPAKGKSRGKVTETPASQQLSSVRRSPRFSSVPPISTSTPMELLTNRSKPGARSSKAAKTPAKPSEGRSDAPKSSAKGAATLTSIAPTPSLNRWETLPEPSSPSLQPDEPSVPVDELMSSSPHVNPIRAKNGRSSQAESSQGKERLFDLSSSQIPFPYSQKRINLEPVASLNGQESDGTTNLEGEPKEPKKRRMLTRYRTLSQLASQATFFPPSLPTPASKSVINGKAKKRAADEDSSSSSSSDADEVDGSEHIPRGRRAASVLETRKKKSLLDKF